MERHGQAWKESLRERPPALDAMWPPALDAARPAAHHAERQPAAEDRVVLELADALQYVATCAKWDATRLDWTRRDTCALCAVHRDDLWLRALNLHACGVSDGGALAILPLLHANRTLLGLDLRANPLICAHTHTHTHSLTQ